MGDGRSDQELLEAFVSGGERAALGELAARHERALLGLARGLLGGSEALACEAVQDSWMRVIKYGKSYRRGASVKTWLCRIVVNRCRDVGRGEGKRATLRLVGTEAGEENARREGPDLDEVARAVEGLDETRREIVLLCYHQGLTHPQVADVLGIPVGTVKSRLHAALGELRRTLGDGGGRAGMGVM